MAVKKETEIPVKVICSSAILISKLNEKGFCEGRKFTMDDYYYVPNNIDIYNMSRRQILSKALIIRYITGEK